MERRNLTPACLTTKLLPLTLPISHPNSVRLDHSPEFPQGDPALVLYETPAPQADKTGKINQMSTDGTRNIQIRVPPKCINNSIIEIHAKLL